jgi:adenosylcobinamide hydrolase
MKRTLFEGIELSVSDEAIVIRSNKQLKILSSAPVNGGLFRSNTIVNLKVGKNFNMDPEEYFRLRSESLKCNEAVCLMTAADVTKSVILQDSQGVQMATIVTAGTSNSTSISDGLHNGKGGTINIIVLVDKNVSEGCMVNMAVSITEAKCKALASLDLRSKFSGELATGTSSDAVLVACLEKSAPLRYAGSATVLGYMIGKNVEEAVRRAIILHDGIVPHRPLEARLEERGITVEGLISAAMEMYVPHSRVSAEDAKPIFLNCLREAMDDINVNSLIMAALRLNEDGERGLIPKLQAGEFKKDPIHLVADEIIGISIAMHLAGYNGLFEFYRFDRKKPGILKDLPPFVDDAMGALLAGASSRMYSEIMERF